MRTITHDEWEAEAKRRFGDNVMNWAFKCPSCHHVAKVRDWQEAGAPEAAVAFSCVGRWMDADDNRTFSRVGGPCQYAGGGLIGLNPVTVKRDGKDHCVFEFAEKILSTPSQKP